MPLRCSESKQIPPAIAGSDEREARGECGNLTLVATAPARRAHLSTVRKASRILVFDAGRIVEAGTFDGLVMAGGRFADLARTQFISTDPIAVPAAVG